MCVRTPVRDLEPGEGIVLDDVGDAVRRARVGDAPDHRGDADVRHDDGVALRLGEEDRVGVEVVRPFWVGLLAGDVEHCVAPTGSAGVAGHL
jgi:hypothetical protein